MSRLLDGIIVMAANGIGFFSVGIALFIAYGLGLVSEDSLQSNVTAMRDYFLIGTMMVWMACAAFSISGLFMGARASRYILLFSPFYGPLFYGLSVLVIFGGASVP